MLQYKITRSLMRFYTRYCFQCSISDLVLRNRQLLHFGLAIRLDPQSKPFSDFWKLKIMFTSLLNGLGFNFCTTDHSYRAVRIQCFLLCMLGFLPSSCYALANQLLLFFFVCFACACLQVLVRNLKYEWPKIWVKCVSFHDSKPMQHQSAR